MKRLLYVTGNDVKVRQADTICQPADIKLIQTELDIVEVQSDQAEAIARDKAEKAFTQLREPLVVSDDSWLIPGLKGFPGPYMKYINEWFSIEDWLNLTKNLTDRRIILRQIVVFQNTDGQQLFSADIEGALLHEPRGKSQYPHLSITSLDGGKHTSAEIHEQDRSATAHLRNVWHEFVEWYGA
jgi:XTP/dITP diphosphohydrolase